MTPWKVYEYLLFLKRRQNGHFKSKCFKKKMVDKKGELRALKA